MARGKRARLSKTDQSSYDVLKSDLSRIRDGLRFPEHWLPVGRMDDLPTAFARLGSGNDIQPFKTVRDYENFLGRVRDFTTWVDTAIANQRKGMTSGVVQPRVIMEKSAAQMEGWLVPDVQKSLFYQPILQMPAGFGDADRTRLTQAYTEAIQKQIVPSYRKLVTFIRQEYLLVRRPPRPNCNRPRLTAHDPPSFMSMPMGLSKRRWRFPRPSLSTKPCLDTISKVRLRLNRAICRGSGGLDGTMRMGRVGHSTPRVSVPTWAAIVIPGST